MSVKRHSRQVLPTPESPISSSRNSTSYCFAMAGTQGDPGAAAGCGLSPAQPLPSLPELAPGRRGGVKEAARPLRWPRPPARSLAGAGKRGCGGSAARGSSRWQEVGGDSRGCRPCPSLRPSPALPPQQGRGREVAGTRRPAWAGSQLGFHVLEYEDQPGEIRLRLSPDDLSDGVGVTALPTYLSNLGFPDPLLLLESCQA